MNAVDDVFSKHGVTPSAESLPERRARRRSTGAAKPSTPKPNPIDWKTLQVGDRIQVRGNPGVSAYSEVEADGVHMVQRIDKDDAALPIQVKFESRWVRAENIMALVEKSTLIDTDTIKIGDWIKVKRDTNPDSYWGSRIKSDGDYEVVAVDRSDRALPIMVRYTDEDGDTDRTWVSPEMIVAIVPKPEVPAVFNYHDLKVGDWIEVKPQDNSSLKKHGVYQVDETDFRDSSLPIRIAFTDEDGDFDITWITPQMIVGRATDPDLAAEPKPMAEPVRGDFLIHVDITTILANREKGEHRPVTVTRRLSEIAVPHIARELAWNGPSRFVHHEFMKIEGTSIQNWIETDAAVTCWRDGEGIEVMTPKPGMVASPMTLPILGAFVIHVAAPVLMKNRAEGRNDPVIAVRRAHNDWATDVIFARKVEWNGPTRMVHRPTTPVPGTNGRGVSFVETDADLTLYLDGAEPMVLRMPRKAAA